MNVRKKDIGKKVDVNAKTRNEWKMLFAVNTPKRERGIEKWIDENEDLKRVVCVTARSNLQYRWKKKDD